MAEYKTKLALLEKTIEINLQRITDKLKEPSSIIALENVKILRDEINAVVEEFNKQIQANNAIVGSKRQKQAECTKYVWELIAFILQSDILTFKSRRKAFDDKVNALQKIITDGGDLSRVLETDIADLNKCIVSTAPTMKSINDLLRDSGFQGFTLREKRGQQNVYEVVRQDGQVATGLSEGERNFIAFLYFYHLVRGRQTLYSMHSNSGRLLTRVISQKVYYKAEIEKRELSTIRFIIIRKKIFPRASNVRQMM